ncbi:hypothetical protein GCM10009760_55570 [Kitasatospora kazusensis]|uniref:PknH-like extracellular domain-containing protein n=1 Tax=Kitasatospora kazusensis TaxID=407974 RepID=A0ABP5M1Y0_9ACTN
MDAEQRPSRGSARVRWRWLTAGAATVCLVLAAVGWRVWPGHQGKSPARLVVGTVQAELLSPQQASVLAGVSLGPGATSHEPPPAIAAVPSSCAVAVGPVTRTVYGNGWSAFLSATYQDAEGTGSYTVSQAIGVFPDNGKAAGALKVLTDGLGRCPSSSRTDGAGRTSKWAYKTYEPTPVAVAWTATQDGGGGWACYRQARLKGPALLQVAVCEAGDGQAVASKIADGFAGKVSG